MNDAPLSLAGLRQHLRATWPTRQELRSPSGDRWLASITTLALLASLLIVLLGGPHAGFLTLNAAVAGLPAPLWGAITSVGDGYVLAAFALFFARRHPHVLWILFVGVLVSALVTQLPKEWLDMPRPAGVLEVTEFNLIGPGHRSKGPPSGHSLAVFMVAGVGIYFLHRLHWRIALLVIASLVAFSRIAVGEHWLLDVTLGAGLGAFSAWLSIALARALPAGRNVWVHLALVLLFLAAAVYLVQFDPPYPGGHQLNIAVGTVALLFFAKSYLVDPLRRRPRLDARGR